MVFLAPHAEERYSAILVWVIPTRGKFKGELVQGRAEGRETAH